MVAGLSVMGPGAFAALEIALVHLYFNLLAVIIIYGIPFLRRIPLIGAERLGAAGSENKTVMAAWIGGVFFALPLLLVVISQLL